MSDDTDRSDGSSTGGRSVLDIATTWYQVPVVALLMAFMLWVRAQSWQNFVRQGQVFFGGNDPWYHYRSTMYVVHHWPHVMPFDPWTYFPYGTSVSQFGTLYDQIVATVALVLGLGSPSAHFVGMVGLFTPVVVGTLIAVPVYYVAKRLGGRSAGVVAVAVFALFPGVILQRSLVGTFDHNIAEPLFQASAAAVFLLALRVAERDRPVWEQVRSREWGALKPVLGWSALAGIAATLYMWVWPPGVLLVAIVGVFFLLKLASVHYNGKSPDHLAFVGVTSMVVTGVLMLVPFGDVGFSATHYSLLQPAAAFGVALASAFLAWLSREFEARDVDRSLYPLSVLGLVVVAAGLVAVVLPSVFHMVFTNFARFVGFDASASQRTIGEAQPWLSSLSRYGGSRFALFFSQYGLAFFAALVALGWMLWRPFYDRTDDRERWFAVVALVVTVLVVSFTGLLPAVAGAVGLPPTWTGLVLIGGLLFASLVVGDHDADRSFVVVWTLFVIAAAFTQVRFNYYLAVPVAALSGYGASAVFRSDYVGLDGVREGVSSVNATQVVAVLAVILVLLVPLAVAVPLSTSQGTYKTSTAQQVGSSAGPGAVLGWYPMLSWMQNNTPAEGNYGGAGNAGQLQYYGTYHATNDYAYPKGSYGVMSWWDYGHWITDLGHRIPDANPFQQGAKTAARYLLAGNETHANRILDSRGSSTEKTRYVAVDWKMASVNSKFSAPTVFAPNSSAGDYYTPLLSGNRTAGYSLKTYVHKQAYYDSMMVRLYRYQGSAMSPKPYVMTWNGNTNYQGRTYAVSTGGKVYRQFNNVSAARAYVAANPGTSQVGGFGRYPSHYVPALKHYRLVGLSTRLASYRQIRGGSNFQSLPYWSKLYERVPGATVEGTGPPNTNVTASVTMNATQLSNGNSRLASLLKLSKNFTYTQRAHTGPNGHFTMTLPYSTTNYDQYGPQNGHTNVSVRAEGPYTFSTHPTRTASGGLSVWSSTANVTEGQVNGANSSNVSVTLKHHQYSVSTGSSSTGSNATGNTSDVAAPPVPNAGASGSGSGASPDVAAPSVSAAPAERGA